MKIRNADISDLETLSIIESKSYPKTEAASKESIRNRLNWFNDCFWLLDDYGEILAFINGMATDRTDLTDEMYNHPELHNTNGNWLMIFSVVTAPEHRHRGYASNVMKQVIKDTKVANRRGIVLTCKEHLIPFYSKFGFVNEGLSESTHGNSVWYQMRLIF